MKKLSTIMASALLFAAAGPLRADEVKLTTALEVGKQLTLALNPGVKLSLTWGDGQNETLIATGAPQTLAVKHPDLTIATTEGKLTSLYLQGNSLTTLNVQKAPELIHLFAADNQLDQINLGECTKLQTVDLQGNLLTAFSVTTLSNLTDLNVANNKLASSSLKLSNAARPHYLVAQGNQLSSGLTAMQLTDVRTLWVSGNQYRTFSLGNSTNLRSLCASGNKIKTLTFGNMPLLHDVWVENNELTKLDLSKGSPKLVTLSADHNQLTEVKWDPNCKNTCRYVYLNNNALFLNSMPAQKINGKVVTVNYQPMDDYKLVERIELNKELDIAPYIVKNGWGLANYPKYHFTNADGQELVSGTDYNDKNRKITFLTSHKGVVLTVTNNTGSYEFRTAPFTVGNPTGIHEAQTANLSITGERGALRITAEQATAIRVYNAAGVSVYNGTLPAGTHRITLAAGIYVVNGVKVVVA